MTAPSSTLVAEASTADEVGPIDFIVIELPDRVAAGAALPPFIDLVHGGLIRVWDFVLVRKDSEGTVVQVDLSNVDVHEQPALVAFASARSGLLDPAEIEEAGRLIAPGSSAALLVYENRWAEPVLSTIRRAGGRLLASERIPLDSLLAALDDLEAKPPH